ncbi:MAG: adenylate/guanylate cyclase domain-containing protein [Betaproteobacteria bacterium]|nr:adenylate/guanylate cyclase domain-containing protein [Betaproteobacteria bacterium]
MRAKPLFLGVIVGLFGVLVNLTPLGLALEENYGLDFLFFLRGPVTVPNDVAVIAIDQPSATALDLPITPQSWPRELHARLIDKLSAAGARAIVFDLLFDKQGIVPEDDAKLSLAMQKARNVVVVTRLNFKELEFHEDSADLSTNRITEVGTTEILPIIADAAMAQAPFPLPKADRVNVYWTFKASAGDMSTIPVVALQVYALPLYDDFVNLLQKVEPTEAAKLPVANDDLDIGDLITTLRRIFVKDSQLAQSMQIELNRDTSLDATKKRVINALINVYAGDESRYINFYGPPRSVMTVPYHQIIQIDKSSTIENQLVQLDFRDKVVFVGFSALTQYEQDRIRDDYNTVFSNPGGIYISGVEIAATAFANLLEGKSVKALPYIESSIVVFLFGLVIGVIFLVLPNRYAAVAGITLAGLYFYFAYYQFKEVAIWLPLIVPFFLQMPFALYGVVWLKRRRLKIEMDKLLPPEEARKIDNNIDSSNQMKLVYGVCLLTDVKGYTSLSARMDKTQLGLLMNEYYGVLFGLVHQHNGYVSNVVGDSMLAIWIDDSTANIVLHKKACLASLDISEAVERFSQSNSRQEKLPTRIGLHAGEMLSGQVGGGERYEFRVVGDVVNTSDRIQGMNKYLGTRVLISSDVVADLDDFLIRPVGSFMLKGKTLPVNLAELVTQKQQASNEQLWLCEVFACALHAYELQEWQEAIKGFSEILKVFPNDGPALYYLKRCRLLMLTPPIGLWDPTIHMESK